jgi:hypothetical protein
MGYVVAVIPLLAIASAIAAVVSLVRRRLQFALGFGLIAIVSTLYTVALVFGGAGSI